MSFRLVTPRWPPAGGMACLARITALGRRQTPLPSLGKGGMAGGKGTSDRGDQQGDRRINSSRVDVYPLRQKRRGFLLATIFWGCRRPRLSWRGRLPKQVSTCTGLVGGCMGRMTLAFHLDTAHRILVRDRDGINGVQVVRSLEFPGTGQTGIMARSPRYTILRASGWDMEAGTTPMTSGARHRRKPGRISAEAPATSPDHCARNWLNGRLTGRLPFSQLL